MAWPPSQPTVPLRGSACSPPPTASSTRRVCARSGSIGSCGRRTRARSRAIGELLRREGLYTSHLTYWRKQRREGALRELGQSRGRKPADRRDREIAELRRRAERAEAELQRAKKVIEIQGNVSALLEQMLGTEGESGSTER